MAIKIFVIITPANMKILYLMYVYWLIIDLVVFLTCPSFGPQ